MAYGWDDGDEPWHPWNQGKFEDQNLGYWRLPASKKQAIWEAEQRGDNSVGERIIHRQQEIDAERCFVATSAYEGNQNHPTVVKLRQYRDDILSNSSAGHKFIEFYYGGFGEKAAKVLDAVPSLKPIVRNSLDLLVEKIVNPALGRRQTFSSQSKSYAA